MVFAAARWFDVVSACKKTISSSSSSLPGKLSPALSARVAMAKGVRMEVREVPR